jgi:pentapeptide repeat protein
MTCVALPVQEHLGNYPAVLVVPRYDSILKVFNCHGPYSERTLTPEELATVLRNHQTWLESDRNRDDERRATLCLVNLQGADLSGANLQEANLSFAKLQEANLSGANLQRASLSGANLEGASLIGANLQRADLSGANLQRANLHEANLEGVVLLGTNLQRANLHEANLEGASLIGANLQDVVYEPNPEKLPSLRWLTIPLNLEKLIFRGSPAALIALREALKKAGMRAQERQITHAIERTRRLQAWNPWWETPERADHRPWLEQLAGKSESLFSYVLFELLSGYGMAPRRALWGLLGLIPIFTLPYWLAIKHANIVVAFG